MDKKRKGPGSVPSVLSYFKKQNTGEAASSSKHVEKQMEENVSGDVQTLKEKGGSHYDNARDNVAFTLLNKHTSNRSAGISCAQQKDNEPNDIGKAVNKTLSDDEKLMFLNETWKPRENYVFPIQKEGKQNRKFNREWLNQHKWLSYSKLMEGGLCTACVLFAPSGAGIGSQVLKTFVKEPLTKFKKAKEDITYHEQTKYHQFSMEKAIEFKKRMDSPESRIDAVIDTRTSAIIDMNRKRLRPIVKTIIFCARNNLPLRGHRDHGLIPDLKDKSADVLGGKHGVFQSLLAFRMDAGDEDLKHHFETCNRNSSMISNTVQNEIIDCIGEAVRSEITKHVKKAKFFAILCDETTDVSTKEQMTFCIRYIDTNDFVIKEDFLGFSDLKSTTGASIEEAIDKEINALGLSYDYLCGQGYDGASNMAGKFKGVQARILEKQPLAVYTHCFSHALNLCISKACDTAAVRNMLGIVGSISVFLSASANRKVALEEVISQLSLTEVKKKKLKAMCPTRWVERHDTLITFKELLIPVITLLDNFSSSSDINADTSSKACMYASAIRRGDFLVALEVTAHCFSVTLRLSEQLQSPKIDLTTALNHVTDVLEVFKNLRRDGELEFENIFGDALQVAKDIGSDISMPRNCLKQTLRDNVPASSAEEYFRRTVFYPVVDHFISELESRFSKNFRDILPLEGLIPAYSHKYKEEEILSASEKYESYLESPTILKSELKLWKNKWERETKLPASAVEALQICDKAFFPNICTLLQIFATIPVTTSTAERSFSSLRRVKSYLRSTMNQSRLNGLALAHVHKEIPIETEVVIDIFSRKKKRRMHMTNWSEEEIEAPADD